MARRPFQHAGFAVALAAIASGCLGSPAKPPAPVGGETRLDRKARGTPLVKAAEAADVRVAIRAMAKEPPQAVGPRGAKYIDSTGNLEAVIPPGALDKDVKIRIMPADTSGLPADEDEVPGMAFAIDFAGARLKPGAAIDVTAPADPRLVTEAKKLDPSFDPAKLGMRQDADGTWLMTMKVRGPAAATEPNRTPRGDFALVETNADPVFLAPWPTAEDVAKAGYALASFGLLQFPLATTGDPAVDGRPPMPPDRVKDFPLVATLRFGVKQKDKQILETRAATLKAGGEFFTCTFKHVKGCKDGAFAIIDDVVLYNKIVKAGRLPSEEHRKRIDGYKHLGVCNPGKNPPPGAGDIAFQAHATYISDDPAVQGTNALPGDRVQFAIQTEPDGASEGVVGAGGLAACPEEFPEGELASVTAYTGIPVHAVGSPAVATVKAGMPPIECTIPKYSPKIILDIRTYQAIKGTLKLEVTLDGQARTLSLPIDLPASGGSREFYQIVPDDADHRFAIVGGAVESELLSAVNVPLPPAIQVHRNGVYRQEISLVPAGAK